MTRSMEKLFVTHAEMRNLYGSENFNPASRFLREIPNELTVEVRTGGNVSELQTLQAQFLEKFRIQTLN